MATSNEFLENVGETARIGQNHDFLRFTMIYHMWPTICWGSCGCQIYGGAWQDMIIVGGENVFAMEVEQVVARLGAKKRLIYSVFIWDASEKYSEIHCVLHWRLPGIFRCAVSSPQQNAVGTPPLHIGLR